MPNRALTFCKWPGCNELTSNGYCDKHMPLHEAKQAEANKRYEKSRGSAASQGYDHEWRKARLAYLRQHPLCEDCEAQGKIVTATMVHHKVAIKDGGARLDMRNLRALCNACHERIEGPNRWKKKTPSNK